MAGKVLLVKDGLAIVYFNDILYTVISKNPFLKGSKIYVGDEVDFNEKTCKIQTIYCQNSIISELNISNIDLIICLDNAQINSNIKQIHVDDFNSTIEFNNCLIIYKNEDSFSLFIKKYFPIYEEQNELFKLMYNTNDDDLFLIKIGKFFIAKRKV